MPRITNSRRESVDVDLGPAGEVHGFVYDSSGSPVAGATVKITNCDNDSFADTTTGSRGHYSVHVGAASGHRIAVYVEWTTGRPPKVTVHKIAGFVTL